MLNAWKCLTKSENLRTVVEIANCHCEVESFKGLKRIAADKDFQWHMNHGIEVGPMSINPGNMSSCFVFTFG